MNADLREAHATACLEAADTHRAPLLALACKLAGSREGGMDLYQQTLLNCHDAIQRNGFAGTRYEFYLRAALKNLHAKQAQQARRFTSLPDEPEALEEVLQESPAPAASAEAQLAEQLMQEARALFAPADRLALRLHLDGHSTREIALLIGGKDYSWVSRRLDRMKSTLRQRFQQAWDALRD